MNSTFECNHNFYKGDNNVMSKIDILGQRRRVCVDVGSFTPQQSFLRFQTASCEVLL